MKPTVYSFPSMSMLLFLSVLLALFVASLSVRSRFAPLTPDKTQPLRGIWAVLIVAFHLSHVAPADKALAAVFHWGAPVVALFFFISGYGLMQQFKRRGQDYLNDFFFRRVGMGILLPWLLAYVLYLLVTGAGGWSLSSSVKGLLGAGRTTLPYSWYVFAILWLYAGFYVCGRFLPRRWIGPALTLWSLFSMLYVFGAGWERCWYVTTLAFPAGVCYASFEPVLLASFARRRWAYGAAFLLMLSLAGGFYGLKAEWSYAGVYVFLPLLVMLPFTRLRVERLDACGALTWLSGMAYEIYLCQGTAFFLTRKFLPERSGAALFIVVAFIVTFALAWGVSRAARIISIVLTKR